MLKIRTIKSAHWRYRPFLRGFGGLRWFVRPVHTLGDEPFAEAMLVSLFRQFPENFYENLMVIVREMGLDQWGFEDRELLAAWRKARAVGAE